MDTETPDRRAFAAVLRLDGSVVLMVKRRSPCGPAAWQLPGGAVQTYETSLEAVRRILREQTGRPGTPDPACSARGQGITSIEADLDTLVIERYSPDDIFASWFPHIA